MAQFPPRRSSHRDELAGLAARFPSERELMLVAEEGGVIVGGALASHADGCVKVDVIALAPNARGRGLGRELMERLEGQAIRLNARILYLGGANTENRGFYQRLGFSGRRSLMQKAVPRHRPAGATSR